MTPPNFPLELPDSTHRELPDDGLILRLPSGAFCVRIVSPDVDMRVTYSERGGKKIGEAQTVRRNHTPMLAAVPPGAYSVRIASAGRVPVKIAIYFETAPENE